MERILVCLISKNTVAGQGEGVVAGEVDGVGGHFDGAVLGVEGWLIDCWWVNCWWVGC